jgi:hypothetical protein
MLALSAARHLLREHQQRPLHGDGKQVLRFAQNGKSVTDAQQ